MRLEDLKKEIPETPEFIHTMIQNEVNKKMDRQKNSCSYCHKCSSDFNNYLCRCQIISYIYRKAGDL